MVAVLVTGTAALIILYLILNNAQSLTTLLDALAGQYVHAVGIIQGRS